MNLHESPEDFIAAISAASKALRIREVYLEKDYWVTFVLKRLSECQERNQIVFKGGTSLSKAYRVIRRFSEDVDLAILKGDASDSATKKLIAEVSKTLTKEPLKEIESKQTSKKGMSRVTSHEYPRNIQVGQFGVVKDTILLEIACFTNPTPLVEKEITSMLGEALKEIDLGAVQEFGLEPFHVQVLDWRITFLEKILSISYASFEDSESGGGQMQARVRHFYDLAAMFGDPSIRSYIESGEMQDLQRIRNDESLSGRIKWKNRRLIESPLFSNLSKELSLVNEYFEKDLKDIVFTEADLLEFEKVKKCFQAIQAFLSKEVISKGEQRSRI